MIDSKTNAVKGAMSRADMLPLAGIFALVLVVYLPMFSGRPIMPDTWARFQPWNTELGFKGPTDPKITNSNNDAILLYIPWNAEAHRELQAGRLPLWDPYCLMGVPLASNHLVPVFYPVYALIAWLVPPLFIMGVSGLVHTLILGFLFYLFLKEWLSPWADTEDRRNAVRFGAWFMASSLVVSMLPNPHYQPWPMTLAFFPGIWFFFERWLKFHEADDRRGMTFAGIWMGICWAVPLMAGYPSLVFQFSLFTVVWILVRPMMSAKPVPKFSRVAILIWPLIIGIALSAVQNVPTVLASRESDRTFIKSSADIAREYGFTVAQHEPWQEHVKRLTQPAIPWKFPKNDFLNRGYLGILPILAAIYSFGLFKDKRYPRWLLGMTLIVLPSALIPIVNFGWYALTRGIAIDPNPPIELFDFMILMLGGVGMTDAIRRKVENIHKDSIYDFVCIIILIVYGFGLFYSKQLLFNDILIIGLVLFTINAWGSLRWDLRDKKRRHHYSEELIFPCLLLLVQSTSLGSFFHNDINYTNSLTMPVTPAIERLQQLTDPAKGGTWGRIIRWDPGPINVMSITDQPYLFYPNLGTYFQIPDMFGYFNLAPKAKMETLRSIEPDAVIENRGIVCFTKRETLENPVLDQLGVKYLLTRVQVPGESKWKLVYQKVGFNIYENPNAASEAIVKPVTNYTMPGLKEGYVVSIIGLIVCLVLGVAAMIRRGTGT